MTLRHRAGVVPATIGIGAQAASQLLAAMLLARMLDAASFGRFALTLGVAAPLVLAVGMQLHVIAATNVDGRVDDAALVRLRLLTVAGLVVVSASLLAIAWDIAGMMWLLGAQLLWRSIDLIGEFVGGLRQRHGEFLASAASQTARAVGAYGAMVCAVAVGLPLGAALLLGAGCAALVVLVVDSGVLRHTWALRELAGGFDRAKVLAFVGMGIAAMLDSFVFNLPRYVVEWSGGSESVALFSVGLYPVMLGGVLASSVAIAVRPALAKHFNVSMASALTSSWKLVGGACAVGVGLTGIGAAVGATALEVVFGPVYADLGTPLVVLLVGATMWYVAGFANSAVVASGRLRGQAQVFALSAGSALACSFVAVGSGYDPVLAGAIGVAGGMMVRAALSVALLRAVSSEGS